jgi:hypothetical protein
MVAGALRGAVSQRTARNFPARYVAMRQPVEDVVVTISRASTVSRFREL